MTFQSQQAAAHGVEEAENLHLDVGPSIIWNSEQDFISNLQFREIFDLNHQIHSFDTQKEPVSISNGSYVFSPLKHAGPSHTGPPFKSTQPLISEPHFRNTDSLISGKKQAEMVAVGSQLQRDSLGINWDVHIDVDDFGKSPSSMNAFQYGLETTRPAYQGFMPKSVATPPTTNFPQSNDSSMHSPPFGSESQIFGKPRKQVVARRPSRKRPRHRSSSQLPSMGLPGDLPWDMPSLSSTTSTLDSTVDEIVSDHAESVIENWLHHFPAVLIPTDDDFKALAILTRLRVETVRMWFGQRLRRERTQPLSIGSNSLNHAALQTMNSSGSQNFSAPAPAPPITQITISGLQQDVLHEAARWVRERGTKCIVSPDPQLLRRYEPRPYQCILGCGKNFDKRADWRKHEEINYPQQGWVCDLASTIIDAGVRKCAFYGFGNPHSTHMQRTHPQEIPCHDKSMADPGKVSYRKQHFKQHFTNAHPRLNCDNYYDNSHFLVASKFPRICGFCTTYRFSSWQDRITHIGDHFSNDRYDMTQWQVFDDEEDETDGRNSDRKDRDFDEDRNDQIDGSGKDFDRHDHGYNDDAFSDFSDDDSDDCPPGSAPKQRAHTGRNEALTVCILEIPVLGNQTSFAPGLRTSTIKETRLTTGSSDNQDPWKCATCDKFIPSSQHPIHKTHNCSCGNLGDYTNGLPRVTETEPQNQSNCTIYDQRPDSNAPSTTLVPNPVGPEREEPNLRLTNAYLPLGSDPGLNQIQHHCTASVHSDISYQMRRFLVDQDPNISHHSVSPVAQTKFLQQGLHIHSQSLEKVKKHKKRNKPSYQSFESSGDDEYGLICGDDAITYVGQWNCPGSDGDDGLGYSLTMSGMTAELNCENECRGSRDRSNLVESCINLQPDLPKTRFTRTRVLGIGPYSIVDEVQDNVTGGTFARKTVHYTTRHSFKALKAEVEIMKTLKHPHIVRFVGKYSGDHSLSILMTPSADFDLDYLIGSYTGPVNADNIYQWFSCLVSSVEYLHAHSIKHQDIKPSNILIKGNTVLLADFGVAKTFNEYDATTSTSENMTKKYCSPETAHTGRRGRKSDIFSLGCVFVEMLSFLIDDNKTSFRDYQRENFVGDGVFHENLLGITRWLEILLSRLTNQPSYSKLRQVINACKEMLEKEPHDRPSAKELAKKFAPGECCEAKESSMSIDAYHLRNKITTPQTALLSSCRTELRPVHFLVRDNELYHVLVRKSFLSGLRPASLKSNREVVGILDAAKWSEDALVINPRDKIFAPLALCLVGNVSKDGRPWAHLPSHTDFGNRKTHLSVGPFSLIEYPMKFCASIQMFSLERLRYPEYSNRLLPRVAPWPVLIKHLRSFHMLSRADQNIAKVASTKMTTGRIKVDNSQNGSTERLAAVIGGPEPMKSTKTSPTKHKIHEYLANQTDIQILSPNFKTMAGWILSTVSIAAAGFLVRVSYVWSVAMLGICVLGCLLCLTSSNSRSPGKESDEKSLQCHGPQDSRRRCGCQAEIQPYIVFLRNGVDNSHGDMDTDPYEFNCRHYNSRGIVIGIIFLVVGWLGGFIFGSVPSAHVRAVVAEVDAAVWMSHGLSHTPIIVLISLQCSIFAWLVASFALVLSMVPGVKLFYSGLARRKTSTSSIWLTITAAATTILQWLVWGYRISLPLSDLQSATNSIFPFLSTKLRQITIEFGSYSLGVLFFLAALSIRLTPHFERSLLRILASIYGTFVSSVTRWRNLSLHHLFCISFGVIVGIVSFTTIDTAPISAGPLNVMAAFLIISILILSVMEAIIEMSSVLSIFTGQHRLGSRTVDKFNAEAYLSKSWELTQWDKRTYGCNELRPQPLAQSICQGPFVKLFAKRSQNFFSCPPPSQTCDQKFKGSTFRRPLRITSVRLVLVVLAFIAGMLTSLALLICIGERSLFPRTSNQRGVLDNSRNWSPQDLESQFLTQWNNSGDPSELLMPSYIHATQRWEPNINDVEEVRTAGRQQGVTLQLYDHLPWEMLQLCQTSL